MDEDLIDIIRFHIVLLIAMCLISFGLWVLNTKIGIISTGCTFIIIPILFIVSYLKFMTGDDKS